MISLFRGLTSVLMLLLTKPILADDLHAMRACLYEGRFFDLQVNCVTYQFGKIQVDERTVAGTQVAERARALQNAANSGKVTEEAALRELREMLDAALLHREEHPLAADAPSETRPPPQSPDSSHDDEEAAGREKQWRDAVQACTIAMYTMPGLDSLSNVALCKLDPTSAVRIAELRAAQANAARGSPPVPTGPVGFLVNQQISGFNKICYYNQLGSLRAVTIGSTQLCALTYIGQ